MVSIAQRAKVVAGEQFYSIYYGIGSHSIHGNWQDILINNLSEEEEEYKLNLDWIRPRPQILDAPIGFNLIITKTFVEKENLKDRETYIERTKVLNDYQIKLQKEHEKFLGKY